MARGSGNIHQYYIDMLPLVSRRSTCVRRSVAAIITNERNQILSTGYNGVPSGFRHCDVNPCAGAGDKSGDTHRCEAVHAEQNAIIQCQNLHDAVYMYCSCSPCFVCAKMILNTPIQVIITAELYPDPLALDMLKRSKVKMVQVPSFEVIA